MFPFFLMFAAVVAVVALKPKRKQAPHPATFTPDIPNIPAEAIVPPRFLTLVLESGQKLEGPPDDGADNQRWAWPSNWVRDWNDGGGGGHARWPTTADRLSDDNRRPWGVPAQEFGVAIGMAWNPETGISKKEFIWEVPDDSIGDVPGQFWATIAQGLTRELLGAIKREGAQELRGPRYWWPRTSQETGIEWYSHWEQPK